MNMTDLQYVNVGLGRKKILYLLFNFNQ